MRKRSIYQIILLVAIFTLILCGLLYLTYKSNSSAVRTNAGVSKLETVIIDAGHGGEDGGAVAEDGTVEKDFNLDISLKLEKLLKLYGFNVIMIRKEDKLIYSDEAVEMRQKKVSDIRNRMKVIEENPDALFISIHQNKYTDSSAHGAQIFYSRNNPESQVLAQSVQNSFADIIDSENLRKVKPTGTEIYLLYHAQSVAIMAECGFVSNENDLYLLKQNLYRQKIAIAIADGIVNYCR